MTNEISQTKSMKEKLMEKVTSKDGTIIAFEQSGTGPVVVLVAAALADRSDTARLARSLAEHFTVINYDRRGRGKSTDTQPYAAEREVEDIEALIDAAGGSAFVFGSSSGSVLALDAASKLGSKVKKLFMYEPPFIIDNSRPPMPDDFIKQVTGLVSAGRGNNAVKLFFTKGMGIPAIAVTLMRLFMPGWSKMAGMAHTLPYDLTILAGTQAGKPLPVERWVSATAPTLVMVGGKSEVFFHTGAQALTDILPNAQYRALEGRDHSAVLMAPKAITAVMVEFFEAGYDARPKSSSRREVTMKGETYMITEPKIEDRKAQPYIGIRTQVPMQELPTVIPQLLGEVFAWLEKQSIEPAGPPFIRYHVINMKAYMDIELGVPVATAVSGDNHVSGGILPAGRYAALVYTGIENGIRGNATLLDWGAEKHLVWDTWEAENGDGFGARFESFLTDPANEPDQAKWETEVAIRLADDQSSANSEIKS